MYEAFGVNQSAFLAWSNGPAHLTWSEASQCMVWGACRRPATQQWHLQRQILGRMRALGVVPVLPAFQGNVPPVLADLYPAANITVQPAHWGGGRAAWLDATDPLFKDIGAAVVRAIVEDFEHVYEADGLFAAGDPPWRRRRQRRRRLGVSSRKRGTAVAATALYGSRSRRRRASRRRRGEGEPKRAPTTTRAHTCMRGGHSRRCSLATRRRWFTRAGSEQLGARAARERLEVMAALGLQRGRGRAGGRRAVPRVGHVERMGAHRGGLEPAPYLFGALRMSSAGHCTWACLSRPSRSARKAPVRVPSTRRPSPLSGRRWDWCVSGESTESRVFTFLFDSNWLRAEKAVAEGEEEILKNRSLDAWWAKYAEQRYGLANMAAATASSSVSEATGAAIAAWKSWGSVYGIDERRNATEGGFWREKAKVVSWQLRLMDDQSDAPVGHSWYDPATLLEAWQCLVTAAHLMVGERTDDGDGAAEAAGTLRYDLVNVGRQVLDEVVNLQFYPALMNATSKDEAAVAGAAFWGCSPTPTSSCAPRGFRGRALAGGGQALANATEEASAATSESSRPGVAIANATMADFYERMARAQITTWLPACSNASEFASGVCSIHVPLSQAGDDDDDGGDDYWSN